jgi:hypothetical protein
MKLPTHDQRDLLRSISLFQEGPERIVDANDYLRLRAFSKSTSNSGSRTDQIPSSSSEKSVSPGETSPLRHPSRGFESPTQFDASDKRGTRYGPDPTQQAQVQKEGASCRTKNGASPQTMNGTGCLQIDQEDDDDYLEPRSLHDQPSYMALLGSSDGQQSNEDEMSRRNRNHPNFANSADTNFVFNPQYFDDIDEPKEEVKQAPQKHFPYFAQKSKTQKYPAEKNYYNDLIFERTEPLLNETTKV